MVQELNKDKAPLPCAMVITRIHRHFGLDLSHKEGKRVIDENVMNVLGPMLLSYRGHRAPKSKSPKNVGVKKKTRYYL